MVSSEAMEPFKADIVRLIHGDTDPEGPGFKEELISTSVNGKYPSRSQTIRTGSYVEINDPDAVLGLRDEFALHAFICPTTPVIDVTERDATRLQVILGRFDADRAVGYALCLSVSGRLALIVGSENGCTLAELEIPIVAGVWYSVGAFYSSGRSEVGLYLKPVVTLTNSRVSRVAEVEGGGSTQTIRHGVSVANVPFLIAAATADGGNGRHATTHHYNGKIERPSVYDVALTEAAFERLSGNAGEATPTAVATWDFSREISLSGVASDAVTDVGEKSLNGVCVHMPTRGVTGVMWSGDEYRYIHAPDQYGAIHFHDDDLEDAGWEPSFRFVVPDDLSSDIYAARLRVEESEDYVPFYILPSDGAAKASIAFLAPTADYLAYANDHMKTDPDSWSSQVVTGHTPIFHRNDLFLAAHPEYGLSTYDTHSDGSGVCYSSRLRPILTMRPKYRQWASVWNFNADLRLIDWLHALDYSYDVLTDEDLDREGVDAIAPYRVVITGSHPEYSTRRMLEALEGYVATGGRVIYAGGNGFYWVTAFHPEKPHLIEVRKFEGSRAWQADPGQYYLSTTGELGGLWRFRGIPPQKIVGTGFTAEGVDVATYFRRLPASYTKAAAWIFDGIDEEIIGDFGLDGGGAAGYEYDRYDPRLGTPDGTLLLAASEGHDDTNIQVVEEVLFNMEGLGGTQNPLVRADMTYCANKKGGAVFSASSISWCGSLAHNDYDNNVSRIMANVVNAFAADDLPGTTPNE
jgi:N,N-dimethylformamidase